MSPGTILAVLGGILAIATAVGVAYGVFRASARSTRIEWADREQAMLTRANARLEGEVTRLQSKTDTLTQHNQVLQEMVTNAAAVKSLAEDIAREERMRREEHQAQLTLIKDLLAEMRRARGIPEGGALGR